MRVTLVQPPRAASHRATLAPPVGLLTVASRLRKDDIDVSVIDFNLRGLEAGDWVDTRFYERAVATVAATRPDVVGFTSSVIDSHVCLELARQLKHCDEDLRVMLGGPHFSAIARETLAHYPWVDFVVTGDGELAARDLVSALRRRGTAIGVPDVARRGRFGIELERQRAKLPTLEDILVPAYDLLDLNEYYQLNPRRMLHFEHAGGTRSSVATYSDDLDDWGHGQRAKRIDKVIDHMERHRALGAKRLSFVAPDFLRSAKHAATLCDAIADADLDLKFSCRAQLSRLSNALIEKLAAAGCDSVLIDVDAVADQVRYEAPQSLIKGWPHLKDRLRVLLSNGVRPDCGFALNEGHKKSNRAALQTAVSVYNFGCGVALETRRVYNCSSQDTPAWRKGLRYDPSKAILSADTHRINEENGYAKTHPELFPHHASSLAAGVKDTFEQTVFTANLLVKVFPRTLMQRVSDRSEALWTLCERVSDHAGDLTEMAHRGRREAVVNAFGELFESSVEEPRAAKEAFCFESAELRLALKPRVRKVRAAVSGESLDLAVMAFERARLRSLPNQYETTERVTPAEQDELFVLVRDDTEVRYLRCGRFGETLLDGVERTCEQGAPLSLARAELAVLERAGMVRALA